MARLTDADLAELAAAKRQAVENANSKDFASYTRDLHAPDCTIFPPGFPPLTGHAQIAAFLEDLPPFANLNLEQVDVDGEGDLAYVRGKYTFDVVDEGGGVIGEEYGSYLEIWRRRNGRWAVVHGMFSSDREH
ncbi:MAG: nuclear transport factor 2 family protein [Gemmatimonadota bacterium]|nr:nuclear transport factor 2 family protein [Gemmatimonadota bacterium]